MLKSRGRKPETFMLFDSREVSHSDDDRLCNPPEQGAAVQYALKFRSRHQQHSHHYRSVQINAPHPISTSIHQTTAIRFDRFRYGPHRRRSRTVPEYDRKDDALIITETECSYSIGSLITKTTPSMTWNIFERATNRVRNVTSTKRYDRATSTESLSDIKPSEEYKEDPLL